MRLVTQAAYPRLRAISSTPGFDQPHASAAVFFGVSCRLPHTARRNRMSDARETATSFEELDAYIDGVLERSTHLDLDPPTEARPRTLDDLDRARRSSQASSRSWLGI